MGYPPRFGGADPDGRPLMPARSPNWKIRQGNNQDTETQTGTALRMLMRHHRIGSHLRSSCVPRSRAGGVYALNIESHCGYATVLDPDPPRGKEATLPCENGVPRPFAPPPAPPAADNL